jgi:hopanoid biosynthesis associated glycosyl transferase protein HpnI
VARSDQSSVQPFSLPPVSILKPLKGIDLEMYESLRSHCLQDYPEYEIVFGVSDINDPATAIVKRVQGEFPNRRLRLVLCDKVLGANRKVSTLAQMASIAEHDFLVVNDSDIRVAPDYLRSVMSKLTSPDTGLVTCLYRGVASGTLASRLESLSISTDFIPGVMAARQIEGGLRFGLGSTLAFRKHDLRAAGGFEAIADYLADDYELGRRIAANHRKVQLAESVVETYLPAYDFAEFFSHQLRWARTIRTSRPGGYAGLIFTFTLPWAALTLAVVRGTAWPWILFAAAALIRVSTALVIGRVVLRDKGTLRSLWLLPIRDVLAVVFWVGGLAGRKIVWRGETFYLEDGKLRRAD